MLKELVQELMVQGRGQAAAVVAPPASEPTHVYFLRDVEGNLTRHEAAEKPFKGAVRDITSLIKTHELMTRGGRAFWYSRDGIFLIGGEARREMCHFPVWSTPQMARLMALSAERREFLQKDFLRLLRIDLYGCGLEDVANLVRSVKFRVLQEGHADRSQAKVSVGRSQEAQLEGTAPIPETVYLDVQPFMNVLHDYTVRVACAIEVNPEGENFRLVPLPGAWEEAMQLAEDRLGSELLRELAEHGGDIADATVLYGKPEVA
jgi:hypothetical protein